MKSYETLANDYDSFMNEIPYNKWYEMIFKYIDNFNLQKPEVITDLCCGTGTMSIKLKEAGFQVTGIDISDEMLAQAYKKSNDLNLDINFFNMDMIDFTLPEKSDMIICCCDGMNYCTEIDEIEDTLHSVKTNLNEDGIFIFDMNTEYKFKEILSKEDFFDVTENSAYYCENNYDEVTKINEYYVTIFTELENGNYSREEEFHYERAYNIVEIQNLLDKVGFQILGIFDDYSMNKIEGNCQRYVFVVNLRRN